MGVIENATSWMEATARDDSHGYDQEFRWGEKGDMDCSSMEITSWQQAGVDVRGAGAGYTGNMRQAFLKCGFVDVTDQIDLRSGKGLRRGDVLLNHKHHTATYCGNGYEVEASINERGGAKGGKPGDQTGREILIRPYRNYPWNCVLRYVEKVPAHWNHDHVGWWYSLEDGTYAHDRWMLIDGSWFYFNRYGYALTSTWEKIDEKWYYFGSDCRMKTGWIFVNGSWFYLRSNGEMATGWIKLNDVWYYLDSWGGMHKGWLKLGNNWFYLRSNGEMATGWLEYDGHKYWFSKDGYMRRGWLCENNRWYWFAYLNDYMYPDGAMVSDYFVRYKGKWYYIGSNGVMIANEIITLKVGADGDIEEVEDGKE